jgi:hypothetical protein
MARKGTSSPNVTIRRAVRLSSQVSRLAASLPEPRAASRTRCGDAEYERRHARRS